MVVLYNFFIALYTTAIRLAALRNPKAKEWTDGRRRIHEMIMRANLAGKKVILVHCASAGELEQAKPVIELLKTSYPLHAVVISFFSPSGFKAGDSYKYADLITYLPLDTAHDMRSFYRKLKPEIILIIKYEFWFHMVNEAKKMKIPVLLISAVFRPGQVFFKWYGGFFKRILYQFENLLVQDEESLQLLKTQGIQHVRVVGDTRFDRVVQVANETGNIQEIENFIQGDKVFIAGSTWEGDEKLISALTEPVPFKIILAPHEIDTAHLNQLDQLFPGSIRYSRLKTSLVKDSKVLILDNTGMLARLYRYATIAYIGGGFTKDGIHNTLEAAVYGKPIIFGTNYKKYKEAKGLLACGGAFSIDSKEQLDVKISELFTDPAYMDCVGKKAADFVKEHTGAAKRIVDYIQENRLLTN